MRLGPALIGRSAPAPLSLARHSASRFGQSLGDSVAMEKFGIVAADTEISALDDEGFYTGSRVNGGTSGYGYGLTSSAAIVGDFVIEVIPPRDADYDTYIGVATAIGTTAFTNASLSWSLQMDEGYTPETANGWAAAVSQGKKSALPPLRIYIIRDGEALTFHAAESYARAVQKNAPIMSFTDTGAPDRYCVLLLRNNDDVAKVKFLAPPGTVTYGPDHVGNGTFDDGTGWTLDVITGDLPTISGGTLNFDAASDQTATAASVNSPTPGDFRVSWDNAAADDPTLTFGNGGVPLIPGTGMTAEISVTSFATGTDIFIRAENSGGTIDNLKIERINS